MLPKALDVLACSEWRLLVLAVSCPGLSLAAIVGWPACWFLQFLMWWWLPILLCGGEARGVLVRGGGCSGSFFPSSHLFFIHFYSWGHFKLHIYLPSSQCTSSSLLFWTDSILLSMDSGHPFILLHTPLLPLFTPLGD